MNQKSRPKISFGLKIKIIFCSLFAEIIKKGITSFIPFFILTIIEIFQNCAFLLLNTFNENNEVFSKVFQISLLVSDFYYNSYTLISTLVSVIITSIFILYIIFIFILVFRNFKSKIKLQAHYIVISQLMFLITEKFLSIPLVMGILQLNSPKFGLDEASNIVLGITKYFLIIIFILALITEVLFYNNDIPFLFIGWSGMPKEARLLNLVNRIFIVLYSYFWSSIDLVLLLIFILINLIILIIYYKLQVPQSSALYFNLILQSYISIIFALIIILNTHTSFINFFYCIIPSLILTQITFSRKFNQIEHNVNELCTKKRSKNYGSIFTSIRYLLARINTLETNSSSENKIVYSFLAIHQSICLIEICPCKKINYLLKQNISEDINILLLTEDVEMRKSEGIVKEKNKEKQFLLKNLFFQLIVEILNEIQKSKNIGEILIEKAYIYFIYLNEPYLAMSQIVKCRQQTKSLLMYFKLYVLYYMIQSKIEKESIIENTNETRSICKLFEYNIRVHKFFKGLNKGCNIAAHLWEEIVKKNPDVLIITKLAEKLNQKEKSIKISYLNIVREYGTSMKISLYYSIFIADISGNMSENLQIIDDAKLSLSSSSKMYASNLLIEKLFGQSNPTFCMLISMNSENYGQILETTSDAANIFNYSVPEFLNLNISELIPKAFLKSTNFFNKNGETIKSKDQSNESNQMIIKKKNNTLQVIQAYQKVILTNDMEVNYYFVFAPLKNLNSYFNSHEPIYIKDCLLFLLNKKNIIVNYNEKLFELLQINQRIEIQSKKKNRTNINIYEIYPELELEENFSNAISPAGLKITLNLTSLIAKLKKELEDYVDINLSEISQNKNVYETRIYIRQDLSHKPYVYSLMAINLFSSSMEDADIYGNEDEHIEAFNSKIENKVEEADVPDLMSSSVSSMSSSTSNFGQSVKMKNSISLKMESKSLFFESVRKYCYILFLIYIIQIVAIVISNYLEQNNDDSMNNAFEEIEELTDFLAFTFDDTVYFRILKNIIEKEEDRNSTSILDRYEFYFNLALLASDEVEISNDILTNSYHTDNFYKGLVDSFSNISVSHIPHNEEESTPIHPYNEYITLKNLYDQDVNAIFILFNIFKSYKEKGDYTAQEMDDLERYMYFLNQNTLDSLLDSFRVILYQVEINTEDIIKSNFIYSLVLLICVFIAFLILTIALTPLILSKLLLCTQVITLISKSKFFAFSTILDQANQCKAILNDTFLEVKKHFSKLVTSIQAPKDNTRKIQNIEDKVLLRNMKEKELLYSENLCLKIYYTFKYKVLTRIFFPLFIFFIVIGIFILIYYTNMIKTNVSLTIVERLYVIQPMLQICVRILKDNIVFGKVETFDDSKKDKLLEYLEEFQDNMENTTDVLSRNKNYFPISTNIYDEFQHSTICERTEGIIDKEGCDKIDNGILNDGFAFTIDFIYFILKRNQFIIMNNLPKNKTERSKFNNDDAIMVHMDMINLYFNSILQQFEAELKEDRTTYMDYLNNLIQMKLIILIVMATLSTIYWILFVLAFVDRQISLTYSLLLSLPNEAFAEFFTLFNKEITNIV